MIKKKLQLTSSLNYKSSFVIKNTWGDYKTKIDIVKWLTKIGSGCLIVLDKDELSAEERQKI
jgi:hypothetical protein